MTHGFSLKHSSQPWLQDPGMPNGAGGATGGGNGPRLGVDRSSMSSAQELSRMRLLHVRERCMAYGRKWFMPQIYSYYKLFRIYII